jgi:hypothetical protein
MAITSASQTPAASATAIASMSFPMVIAVGPRSQRQSSARQANKRRCALAQAGPAATLAFYNFVTLLQQALALAILALLLLFDVGAFFVGHDGSKS